MDSKLKKKWVEALRSGKYRQTQYTLRDECNGFCCLGVLADVANLRWKKKPHNGNFSLYKKDYSCVALGEPDPHTSYTPLKENICPFEFQKDLSSMNDSGHSFEEIADYIEENL